MNYKKLTDEELILIVDYQDTASDRELELVARIRRLIKEKEEAYAEGLEECARGNQL